MWALIGVLALVALLGWFMGFGPRRPLPAPEDDVETPIARDELAEAEQELANDPGARPIHEALKGEDDNDDDDWGPGSGRSALPGII